MSAQGRGPWMVRRPRESSRQYAHTRCGLVRGSTLPRTSPNSNLPGALNDSVFEAWMCAIGHRAAQILYPGSGAIARIVANSLTRESRLTYREAQIRGRYVDACASLALPAPYEWPCGRGWFVYGVHHAPPILLMTRRVYACTNVWM